MRRNKATEKPGEIQKSAPGAQEEAQLLPSKWEAKLHNGHGQHHADSGDRSMNRGS